MSYADPISMPQLRLTPEEGRSAIRNADQFSALLLRYGSMELRWCVPQHSGPHTPHDRDEIYVIVSGTGVFVRAEESLPFSDDHALSLLGEERVTVKPGDTLFVPAGTSHQFEAVSPDFGAWMIFYGPEGGERP